LYIVAYVLKARTVEPYKQPLLANGYETSFVSRQMLGKHIPAATNTHETIEILWKRYFLLCPCNWVIRKATGATQSVLYGSL
jgi:hypothetical protein